MITKRDVFEYFSQLEKKVHKVDDFYGHLYSRVDDLDVKEMLLQLKCEEKIYQELILKLKEIFQKEWE